MRAVIYVRISKDKAGAGLGVERQEYDCRQVAERNGWDVADVYVDNDLEASSGKPRPDYLRLLADMREGRVQAVLAWHTDRLYRRPDELEELIVVAEAAGVEFDVVKVGKIDLRTASGRLVARMLAAAAKYETELKAERQVAQLEQRRREGKVSGGGSRPYGYTSSSREQLVDHEAAIIRAAAERVLAGESVGSVCIALNEAGEPTATGKVGTWNSTVLGRLLMSPTIAGSLVHKGQVVRRDAWPAIITHEQHEQLVRRLTYTGPPRRNPRKALLTGGVAVCGLCGYELVSFQNHAGAKGYRAYGCRSRYLIGRPGYGKSCGKIGVRAEPFEEDMAERVLARLAQRDNAAAIARVLDQRAGGSIDAALAELQDAEQRMRDLAEDYADGHLDRLEFRAARDRLAERIAQLRPKVVAATPAGGDLTDLPLFRPEALAAWWEGAPTGKRRALLRTFLAEVRVGPHKGSRSRYDETRFTIEWR